MRNSLLILCWLMVLDGIAQNTGIGVSNPVHARLEINGSVGAAVAMFGSDKFGLTVEADNPEIGFNYYFSGTTRTIKAGYAANMGMYPSDGSFYIGTFNGNVSVSDFGPITGYREALRIKQNGNIGIGTDPLYPLSVKSVSGGGIVQESPDGTAQVGFWTGTNAAYLQTWTNTPLQFATGNGVSRMVLNTNGTFVISKSLHIGGRLLSVSTGVSGLAPIAYGSVNQDGSMLQSTGNVSVSHTGTGSYSLTISGEDLLADANKYTVLITPRSANDNTFLANWSNYSFTGGSLRVNTGNLFVNAQVTICGCNQSYITSSVVKSAMDCPFDFTVYKNN